MKSPFEQNIVQIDITDACPHNCANCTRYNRNKKHHYMMDFDTFKKCVDSVVDYPGGLVGIMGGEPTLHPEFEKFLEYYASKIGPEKIGADKKALCAMRDFADYRKTSLAHMKPKSRRGLFSSVSKTYAKHYELIQDIFPEYQCLNDHAHPGRHTSLLCASKELIPDDKKRAALVNKCWINGTWSASMTPRGAYFCEVAGQLDMLFASIPDKERAALGMPKGGGAEIVPGWWKKKFNEFGDQNKWCDFCGAAMPCKKKADAPEDLPDLMPLANVGREHATPGMYALLERVESPRVRDGHVEILRPRDYQIDQYDAIDMDAECYLPEGDNEARVASAVQILYPKKLSCVITCINYSDYLDEVLPVNRRHFDELIVVTDRVDERTLNVCKRHGVKCVQSDRAHVKGAVISKGEMINDGIAELDNPQWILCTDADVILPYNFRRSFDTAILNPGVLYWTRRIEPNDSELPRVRAALRNDMLDFLRAQKSYVQTYNDMSGYFQLFNLSAMALRGQASIYPEGFPTAERVDRVFAEKWPMHKQLPLPSSEFQIVHLPHNKKQRGVNWGGRKTPILESIPHVDPISERQDGWQIVFRGRNPQQWGIRNAIPRVANAIRLRRVDTGALISVALNPGADPSRNCETTTPGLRWIGQSFYAYGAIHLGIAQIDRPLNVAQAHKGVCVVDQEDQRQYSGYGFGHAMLEDNRQVIVWDGQEIDAEIEISLCYGVDDALTVDLRCEEVCAHEWATPEVKPCLCEFSRCPKCGVSIRSKTCAVHSQKKPTYDYQFYLTLGNFKNGVPMNRCVDAELRLAFGMLDFDLPYGQGEGRVLEVGAGIGRLATYWLRNGYQYEALEVSEYGAEFIRECYGATVHKMPFENFESAQPYDIVFSQHVLEHIPYAGDAFAKMARITAPGGYVIALVPQGTDRYNPDHYALFDDGVLRAWGKRAGLVDCREYRTAITRHEDYIYFAGRKKPC